MFKKSLLIMLLMAFVAPFAATAQQKAATDMWDFVNSFSCSTGRQRPSANTTINLGIKNIKYIIKYIKR